MAFVPGGFETVSLASHFLRWQLAVAGLQFLPRVLHFRIQAVIAVSTAKLRQPLCLQT